MPHTARLDNIAKTLFAKSKLADYKKLDKTDLLIILDHPETFMHELRSQYYSIRKSCGDNTNRHAQFNKMQQRLKVAFKNELKQSTGFFKSSYTEKYYALQKYINAVPFESYGKYQEYVNLTKVLLL